MKERKTNPRGNSAATLFPLGAMFRLAVAACAILFATDVAAQSMAPVNPAFRRWQQEQKRKAAEANESGKPAEPATKGAPNRSAPNATPESEEEDSFGYVPELVDLSYLSDLNSSLECGVGQALPSRFNLADKGNVTSVKNQNPYGTCWAFATMGSLESSLKLATGDAFDFSENNLANRHGWSWGFNDGGNASMSSAYLLRWSGPVLERNDPYPAPGSSPEVTPAFHVQRVRWIPGKVSHLDNDDIKSALLEHGALYASIYWSSAFYDNTHSSYYLSAGNPNRLSNHAVTLVGWDDNYPRSNFADTPPRNGAWIVKNSWGEDWGDNGYFYVSYYDESFAWNTLYSFSGTESADNYDAVYQYDPLGMVASFGGNGSSAWAANLFTATAASKVAAVGFYAMVPLTSYTVYVYTGCSAGKPTSGTLALTQNGKTDSAGYVTVPLSSAVPVSAGTRFSVVLHLVTPGYPYPVAFEFCYPGVTDAATASAGQSFFSDNGTTWLDFTSVVHPTANFCCKAYVKGSAVEKTLSSLSISGVSTIMSGKSATFSCTAVYSDGSTSEVSPDWAIVSGGEYASVNDSGVVTAGEVDAQQTVTLRASYEEDGVSKTADWSFYVTISAPSAPIGIEATQGGESSCVRLTWNASAGAASYAVYRATTESPRNAAYIGATTSPRYSDTTAVPGKDYTYFVKAKNDSGSSPFSTGASGWRALSAPTGLYAADGASLDAVAVDWESAEGASFYRVFRSSSPDAEPVAISGWQEERTFSDTTAVPGTVYCYYVLSALDADGLRASGFGVPDEGFRAEPVTMKSLDIAGPATLASGASGSYTCTAVYSDGSRVAVTPVWSVNVGSAAVDGASAVVTAPVTGGNLAIVLSASYADAAGSVAAGTREIAVTPVRPDPPTGLELVSATTDAVTFRWTAVADATSYIVWRGTSDSDRGEIATATSTTFADVTGTPGEIYRYWVASANGAGSGEPGSDSVSAARRLAPPTGLSATFDAFDDKVALAWRASEGATHYRVFRTASATGEKTPVGPWQTSLSLDDTTAVAGTIYTYFVKAAASSDGAAESAFGASAAGRRKVAPSLVSLELFGPDVVPASGMASYTAKARYDNDAEILVAPVWSIFEGAAAASVTDDGTLTASAVTENAVVVLIAVFADGVVTQAASKSVTILAPAQKTATVVDVVAKSRWPWNGFVDVDFTLQTAPSGTLASVSLSGYDLDHRTAMAATTVSGDGADGSPVAAGAHRLTWNLGADYPEFHAKEFRVSLNAAPQTLPPEPPVGLSASDGADPDAVLLSWSASKGATAYQVWRADSDDSSAAVALATVSDVSYVDSDVRTDNTYYYWAKAGSALGWSEFSSGDSGYPTPSSEMKTLADNLVAWYSFDGDATDSSGNGNHGVVDGATPAADRNGKADGAYSFDGNDDFICVPDSETLRSPTNAITIAVWLKPEDKYLDFAVCGKLGPTSIGKQYGLWFFDGSTIDLNDWYNTGGVDSDPCWQMSASLQPGTWQHVVATWDGATACAYLNGVFVGSCHASGSYRANDDDLVIGLETAGDLHPYNDDRYYNGCFDDLAIWSRALTADEAARLYSGETPWSDLSGTYTVHFDANGGSGAMPDQSFKVGRSGALADNAFEKTNCFFAGWAMTTNGPAAYTDGQFVANLSFEDGATVTLYAVWEDPGRLNWAVNATNLVFSTGGNARWFAQASDTHDGVAAARSGSISHDQNTWVETTVEGTGTISFWWKVSSHWIDADWVEFLVDGIQTTKIGGTRGGWEQVTLQVEGSGPHALRWNYRKNDSSSAGSDCAWLDQVSWTPVSGTYTVRFDSNGGSGTMEDAVFYCDFTSTLPSNVFTKADCYFAGWATTGAVSGVVDYPDRASVRNLAPRAGSTVWLHAVWDEIGPVPTNGLVAFYPFDGSTADESGNGYDLDNHGCAFGVDRFGDTNCVWFGGTDGQHLETQAFELWSSFSVSCWVRTDVSKDRSETGRRGSLVYGNFPIYPPSTGNPCRGIGFKVGVDGMSVVERGPYYQDTKLVYDAAIGNGWNHVCLVVENDTIVRCYLNGELVSAGALSDKMKRLKADCIGGRELGCYAGSLDDVYIYDRAITDRDVQRLYQSGRAEPGSGN